VDLKTGEFVEVACCPGFVRGMSFVGQSAVVGLSATRENRTFSGLPLDENLKERDAAPRCGMHVINTETGNPDHGLRVEGVVHELYDVVSLRGVQRPKLLGFKTDEIRRTLRVEEAPGQG